MKILYCIDHLSHGGGTFSAFSKHSAYMIHGPGKLVDLRKITHVIKHSQFTQTENINIEINIP